MWLLDKNETIKETLKVVGAIHFHKINGENYLRATIENHVEKYDRILYKDEHEEFHEFIVQGIEENKDSVSIYAEHSSYELHGAYIRDRRPTETVKGHLDILLADTRWRTGTVEMGQTIYASYYYQTVYNAVSKLVDTARGEVKYRIEVDGNQVVGRYVDILNRLGVDIGKRFSYRKDLEGVTRTVVDDDVYTALVGRGRGEEVGDGYGRRITFADLDKPDSPSGVDYVYDNDSLEEWGIGLPGLKAHRIGMVEFDDIEDVEELYTATKERLQEVKQPRVNYEMQVVLLDDTHEGVTIGDTVLVLDKDFRGRELRFSGRIIQFEKDLTNLENSRITIGQLLSSIADYQLETEDFIRSFRARSSVWDRSNAFDSNNNLEASYIKNLLEEWNDKANQSGGYTYTVEGEGMMTFDKPIDDNPTRVVQVVGGTVRIANSKLPNGDWDWRTVINADGIAGQEIIAQSITANQLRSDAGQNLDLSSNESISLTVKDISYTKTEVDGIVEDIEEVLDYAESNIDILQDQIVLKSDTNGNLVLVELDSSGSQGTSFTVKADNIDLTGYVTISNLTSEINATKSYADTQANTAQSNAKTYTDNQIVAIDGVLKSYTDSEISAFSGGLGDMAFKDKVGLALLDNTIISGGYIKTNLISFDNAVGTNVDLTGTITAASGKIGDFNIDALGLSRTWSWTTKKFTNADFDRVQQILTKTVTPTQSDYDQFDLNRDGRISNIDLVLIQRCLLGYSPNPLTITYSVNIKPNDPFSVLEFSDSSAGAATVKTAIGVQRVKSSVGDFERLYLDDVTISPLNGEVMVNNNKVWHAGNQAENQFPNTSQSIGASQNLNDYTTPGFYYQNSNANAASGSNYPVARAGTLIVTRDAGTTQMYYEYSGRGMFYRTLYGSSWSSWLEIYHSGNLPHQIETGSEPTGEYVRYPDGTQICWARRNLGTAAATNGQVYDIWVYPKSFVGIPSVTFTPEMVTTGSANALQVRFGMGNVESHQARAGIENNNASQRQFYANWHAIGRWK